MQTSIDQLVAEYETARLTRRELLFALTLAGTSTALTGRSMSAQTRPQALRARSIKNVSIGVSDVQRSAAFYQQLFDLPAVRTMLSSGNEAYGLDFNGRFISLQPQSDPGLITHFSIGVDNFRPGREGEALRAAGFEVTDSSDDYVFVRDPDGVSVQITDTNYTAACAACTPPPARATGSTPIFRGRTLNHVSMGVSDLANTIAFYQNLFSLSSPRPLLPTGSGIFGLDINESYLSLSPSRARVGTITHFCIGVEDFELERDLEKIRAIGLEVRELTPGGGDQTLYVNDPDGLSVQISGSTWKSLCPACDPTPPE